jgi:hypothetical protein
MVGIIHRKEEDSKAVSIAASVVSKELPATEEAPVVSPMNDGRGKGMDPLELSRLINAQLRFSSQSEESVYLLFSLADIGFSVDNGFTGTLTQAFFHSENPGESEQVEVTALNDFIKITATTQAVGLLCLTFETQQAGKTIQSTHEIQTIITEKEVRLGEKDRSVLSIDFGRASFLPPTPPETTKTVHKPALRKVTFAAQYLKEISSNPDRPYVYSLTFSLSDEAKDLIESLKGQYVTYQVLATLSKPATEKTPSVVVRAIPLFFTREELLQNHVKVNFPIRDVEELLKYGALELELKLSVLPENEVTRNLHQHSTKEKITPYELKVQRVKASISRDVKEKKARSHGNNYVFFPRTSPVKRRARKPKPIELEDNTLIELSNEVLSQDDHPVHVNDKFTTITFAFLEKANPALKKAKILGVLCSEKIATADAFEVLFTNEALHLSSKGKSSETVSKVIFILYQEDGVLKAMQIKLRQEKLDSTRFIDKRGKAYHRFIVPQPFALKSKIVEKYDDDMTLSPTKKTD